MFRQTDYATTLEKLSEPGTSPDFEDRARMRELLSYLSEEKCLSTGDAARYFRVGSINTIKRWIDRGILRAYMRAGQWEIPLSAAAELRAIMESTERSNRDRDYMPEFTPRKRPRL